MFLARAKQVTIQFPEVSGRIGGYLGIETSKELKSPPIVTADRAQETREVPGTHFDH